MADHRSTHEPRRAPRGLLALALTVLLVVLAGCGNSGGGGDNGGGSTPAPAGPGY
jgi:hypothetical protein